MSYKNHTVGMLVIVVFNMPIIYSADESRSQDFRVSNPAHHRDLFEEAKKNKLSDRQLTELADQQFAEKRSGEGWRMLLGSTVLGVAIYSIWLWFTSEKKSDQKTEQQGESSTSTDAAANAGSESQSSASLSDSSPQS